MRVEEPGVEELLAEFVAGGGTVDGHAPDSFSLQQVVWAVPMAQQPVATASEAGHRVMVAREAGEPVGVLTLRPAPNGLVVEGLAAGGTGSPVEAALVAAAAAMHGRVAAGCLAEDRQRLRRLPFQRTENGELCAAADHPAVARFAARLLPVHALPDRLVPPGRPRDPARVLLERSAAFFAGGGTLASVAARRRTGASLREPVAAALAWEMEERTASLAGAGTPAHGSLENRHDRMAVALEQLRRGRDVVVVARGPDGLAGVMSTGSEIGTRVRVLGSFGDNRGAGAALLLSAVMMGGNPVHLSALPEAVDFYLSVGLRVQKGFPVSREDSMVLPAAQCVRVRAMAQNLLTGRDAALA